jgi:CubicO group peptidase (beta-lactamase class C family)
MTRTIATLHPLRRLVRLAALASLGVGFGFAQGSTGILATVRGMTPEPLERAVETTTEPVTQVVSATAARMAEDRLGDAERLVRDEVRRGAFPGAALAAGRGARLAMMRGIGSAEWGRIEVDPERTVYDIASLSKVVATTTAVMLLFEDGKLDLDAPVRR